MKKSIALLAGVISLSSMASEDPLLKPVYGLFDGMRAGDATAIKAQFIETASLERHGPDGQVKANDIAKFAASIEAMSAERKIDEQIFDVKTDNMGSLGSVWAPFKLYVDGKLVSCGVNHFRLVKRGNDWKIASLADYSKRECE